MLCGDQSMELRHLRYFVVAAEEENLHRAAARLHIVQSALSRQIIDLERELGIKLFERERQRIRLSDAGRKYLESARRLLLELENANHSVRRVADGLEGRLRLSVHYAALYHAIVPRSLHAFRTAFAAVDVQFSHQLSDPQIHAIRSGEVDAGFTLHQTVADDADLESLRLGEDRFLLALPNAHPLLKRPVIRLADLVGEPFLWLERSVSPSVHDRLMGACLAGGLSPRIAQYVLSLVTCPKLVSVGMGLSFVLESTRPEDRSVHFREVVDLDLRQQLDLIWRRDDRSAVLSRFIDVVRSTAGELRLSRKPPALRRARGERRGGASG
jgi:DNA-binding transcriptional LysR family regulator